MKLARVSLAPFNVVVIWVFLASCVSCQIPDVVKIGAIFNFDSVIGKAAKPAIEAAVSDVNADPRILNGTELKLIIRDNNCSVFLGSISVFQVIEEEVVAIIGPLSSSIAHMIGEVANGLQVPLVSFAATDPTLSSLQFPYFLRTTPNDSSQMAAIADLVDFYGWKEVIAIYVDDDYGRNGIAALDDELDKKMAKISCKLPLPVGFDENNIKVALNTSRLLNTRVYIVHVSPDPRLRIFKVAQKLGMMTSNHVWFATDWLSVTLESFSAKNQVLLNTVQGVVGLRQHIPDSSRKKDLLFRWRNMHKKGLIVSPLNVYGLRAYDTVWAVAYGLDKFINDQSNLTFSFSDKLIDTKASKMQIRKLKVFDGGAFLRGDILKANFTGLTGQFHFDVIDRNIVSGGYDVLNINQMRVHTVGYWSKDFGLSVSPPETLRRKKYSFSPLDQRLHSVVWPGGETEKPRGWVVANSEKPLKIGVPYRASFVDFVTEIKSSHKIIGYCIDVFMEARKIVPYDVPYSFELFGDGQSNPNYNELVKMVANGVFDAAVGDIAIVKNRTQLVDFSQPYTTTGLVIVAPIKNSKSSAWVFLKPFTPELWFVIAASFVMIGVVVWILEHRVNDDFRGPPRKQLVTMFLFSFSTLFKTNQEDTVSPLGRLVMVVWLFLLMVITASYTASLTSILTVQQLSSPITGIDSLIAHDWPIGYQVGSFAYGYLVDSLYVKRSRLVALGSPEEYERALRQGPNNGGVAAIVDELTYVELFLSKRTEFGIIGQPFTRSGWGFAFQKGSPLAVDMSTAILKLSESGELQEIHNKWFCKMGCPGDRRRNLEPNQLHTSSFWGLYLWCGAFSLLAFFVFLLRVVCQYARYKKRQMEVSSSHSSSNTSTMHCSQVIYNFFYFIDEKEEAIKKMFTKCENSQPQVDSTPRNN